MRKAEITRHIQYSWWCYLLLVLVSVVLWTSVYGILEKPNANQKLTVSYFGEGYDGAALQGEIEQNLSIITDQEIKEVTLDIVKETNESLFGSMLQTRLYSSDIMIFGEGTLTDEFITMSFRPMTTALEAYFDGIDIELYSIDGINYGIVLNSEGDSDNNFSKYYSGDKKLIAFFAPYGVNLGGAYGSGNNEDKAAIELLIYLLEGSNA